MCARLCSLPPDYGRVSEVSYQGSVGLEAGVEGQAFAKTLWPGASKADLQTLPTAMPVKSVISVKGQVDPPGTKVPFSTLYFYQLKLL